MGKQIRFFMTEIDEYNFLKTVSEHKHILLDSKSKHLTFEEALASKELMLFIALSDSKIIVSKSGFIDQITAEVIEFARCKEWMEKVLDEGRLWVKIKYYDNSQQLCTKSRQVNEVYNIYVKWIKKNHRISKCKDYYVGPDAYQKYKNKGYIMKAGPKHFVEFD